MTFAGAVARIFVQWLLMASFIGSRNEWLGTIIFGVPISLLSVLIYIPVEHLAAKHGKRWLGLAAIGVLAFVVPAVAGALGLFNPIQNALITDWVAMHGLFWVLASIIVRALSKPSRQGSKH